MLCIPQFVLLQQRSATYRKEAISGPFILP